MNKLLIFAALLEVSNAFQNNYCKKQWAKPTIIRQITTNIIEINRTAIPNSFPCCITELEQTANILKSKNSTEKCFNITVERNKIRIRNFTNILVKCVAENQTFTNVFYLPQKLPVQQKIPRFFHRNNVNVLIVGLDSISYHQLQGHGPRIKAFLRENNAVEMQKFNGIHSATYVNMMPLIMGQSFVDLRKRCAIHKRKIYDHSRCPAIWKEFNKLGYVTAFGEDLNEMGIFDLNSGSNTMKSIQVDFDYRAHDSYTNAQIGHATILNSNMCVADELRFTRLLKNIAIFTRTYKDRPFFGFFWGVSLTPHEFGYFPDKLDIQMSQLFKFLRTENILENTIMMFMSDHGSRARRAPREEIPHPFLYIILPASYQHKRAILQRNANKMTNVYDVHATIYDIVNAGHKGTFKRDSVFGQSLFTPISKYRGCKRMGTPKLFCKFCKSRFWISNKIRKCEDL